MKIDEAAKKIIDKTNRVRAKVDNNNSLIIASLNRPYEDWFLMFPAKATSWNQILEFWSCLDRVTAQDLACVMDVIQRLLDTPVKERFSAKKYRIRFSSLNSDNGHQYLSTDTIGIHGKFFACALRFGLKQEFTESEITEMLNDPRFKSVPWFRELICNGKEEVKDDENS